MTEPKKNETNSDIPMRRRLLKGGLGASPLLMTLVSRPVLGHGSRCVSPSGFTSMPSSRQPQVHRCDGGTPGYWKNHLSSWPAPYLPKPKNGKPATTFNSVFSYSPYSASKTLLQVLEMESGPPHSVARHIVAALLNAQKGWTTVMTVAGIKNIWNSYRTLGYFEPTAGVRWYHDQIQNYLESTMQRD